MTMKTGVIFSLLISLTMIFAQTTTAGADVNGRIQRDGDMSIRVLALSTHHAAQRERPISLIHDDAGMFKVISVLEKRIHDRELIEKVKHKLPALNEKRLKMLVSLSDRMAASASEPEDNIAFLLIATLIIFS
jgi:hypothetical protein